MPHGDYDSTIYSPFSVSEGGEPMHRLTWKEHATRLEAEVARLQPFANMVTDLDRNANGRHEGDADGGDLTGVSQGNPRLHTGDILGYGLAGARRAYVMPPIGQRHLCEAWVRDITAAVQVLDHE